MSSNASSRVNRIIRTLKDDKKRGANSLCRLSVSVDGKSVNGGKDLIFTGMDGDTLQFTMANGLEAEIYEHAMEGWKYSDPIIGSGLISHINGIQLRATKKTLRKTNKNNRNNRNYRKRRNTRRN